MSSELPHQNWLARFEWLEVGDKQRKPLHYSTYDSAVDNRLTSEHLVTIANNLKIASHVCFRMPKEARERDRTVVQENVVQLAYKDDLPPNQLCLLFEMQAKVDLYSYMENGSEELRHRIRSILEQATIQINY